MVKTTYLTLLFILAGCASVERDVKCEAECDNCEKVKLTCSQETEKKLDRIPKLPKIL